jgi:hypothetical protein
VEVIPPEILVPVNPLLNVWVSSNPKLSNLDLRNIDIGGTFASSDVLETQCLSGGFRGDPAITNGVTDDSVRIIGNGESGLIQFGRLQSTAPNNNADVCLTMATEKYSYVVTGNVLRLCNLNYLNPDLTPIYCDNYTSL